MSVGTYSAWETTVTLRCAWRRWALRRPQREDRGRGITWRPPASTLLVIMLPVLLQFDVLFFHQGYRAMLWFIAWFGGFRVF